MPVIAMSAVAVSRTGATGNAVMVTVPIPASTASLNDRLRITSLWTTTNSANNKTVAVYFGATGAGLTGTQYYGQTVTTSASIKDQRDIFVRGTLSTQVGFSTTGTGGWGNSTNAVVTSSINMANASEIVFAGNLANAGETITLEAYCIELIRSP